MGAPNLEEHKVNWIVSSGAAALRAGSKLPPLPLLPWPRCRNRSLANLIADSRAQSVLLPAIDKIDAGSSITLFGNPISSRTTTMSEVP